VKENAEKAVVYDEKSYAQMLKDVPSYKLITTSIVSDRLKINASLARRTLRHLEKEGKIRRVIKHSSQMIYTRAVAE
jgi:small subunit ribosomal protein S25e